MAIIRVSGHIAAGKTTISERLAQALGYKSYYTGGIFRQMAAERSMGIEEFYKQMAENPELEKEIDNKQAELMMKEDNIVVQGRIAPFLPWNQAFQKLNILFKVSHVESTKRQLKLPENSGRTFDEMLILSGQRANEEKTRYAKLYPHIPDYMDERLFDIIVDTTTLTRDEVFNSLFAVIKAKLKQP